MVIARVTFFGPERGGRRTAPRTGYHPQLRIADGYASCIIESLDGIEVFELEHEYTVSLRLMVLEHYYSDVFSVGAPVAFYEGARRVGAGTVILIREGPLS